MKRPVHSAPPAVAVGSKGWRDATVRSILRAEDLLRQTHVDQLHSSTRYRSHSVGKFNVTHRHTQLTDYSVNNGVEKEHNESDSKKKECRLKSTGSTLTSGVMSRPFPPPALRDQSAVVSTGMAGEYMRGVREVEGHLRRQAGRVTQEGTRVEHQREQLEKLLRNLRKALLVNQQSTDGRTFRPATTETIMVRADDLLNKERRGLNVLKQELESMLRKTLTQQQQHLTLSSAATRQAFYRKQRQMQCAGYSLGRAMGPVCSADLYCRERLSRPMTQLYGRHSSVGLPESDLLTQGSTMLRKHLESSGKEIAELQVVHQQLENDKHGKRAAAGVDSAVVRLRQRLVHPQSVRPATS
ncbi:coiled-coil domain-containing protein 105-like [Carassius auratus]|uniref:Coiled-coil domain-containing protein 105-like n=1 Tax=Carassius auratus TaxID=7957 RepID=A0A6P6NRS4_CARAU|nr:coiled-coil domain-containing protein 105-like [Carassius auratus]